VLYRRGMLLRSRSSSSAPILFASPYDMPTSTASTSRVRSPRIDVRKEQGVGSRKPPKVSSFENAPLRQHRERTRGDDLYDLLQTGRLDETLALFNTIKKENQGRVPNIMVYNTMLLWAEKKRDPAAAVAMFEEICNSKDIRPNFRSYSQLIVVLVTAMKMIEAQKYFDKLVHALDTKQIFHTSMENVSACAARVISRKDER
jgi:hypothetical protein